MKRKLVIALIVLPLAAAGCGKKDGDSHGKASLALKIRAADAGGASLTDDSALAAAATAGAGNVSFTPESFKMWIYTIVLQSDAGASDQFYTCDTSEAACEVDFADPASTAAFEAKLSNLPISAGTYDKVWLSASTPTTGGYIKIKGHAVTSAGTKYTADPATNGGSPVTDDPTKVGIAKIVSTGGNYGLTMRLAKPLVVGSGTADATQEVVAEDHTEIVTMFSNLRLVSYYGGNISPGLGGCVIGPAAANSGAAGFCSVYPSVFPYFGETAPTVEYYKVANAKTSSDGLVAADANVLVKVIKAADGTPFWAAFGNMYAESTPDYGQGDKGVSGYANAVSQFAVNADASLTIRSQSYGFAAFRRADHTGDVVGEGILNGAGTGTGVTYHYHAFPWTP